jgi:hypothetical protein
MLTSSQNVEDLEGPDQLQTHMMYNGVKLTFGAKSNSPASVYKSQVDDALITQDKITQEEYKIKLDAQKKTM